MALSRGMKKLWAKINGRLWSAGMHRMRISKNPKLKVVLKRLISNEKKAVFLEKRRVFVIAYSSRGVTSFTFLEDVNFALNSRFP